MHPADNTDSPAPANSFFRLLVAFKRTMRIGNCLMGILIVFIGSFAALGGDFSEQLHNIVPASLVAFFLMAGGNMLNDVSDAEIDRKTHPKRAIPRGIFTRRFVLLWALAFYAAALFLAALINPLCFLFALGGELLLVMYELFLKRYPGVGNVVIGSLVGCVFLGAAAAIGRWRVLLFLALLGSLINIAREMIKDVEDMEGDTDRATLPRKVGVKATLGIAAAVLAVNVAVSPLPYYPLEMFSGYGYPVLIGITDAMVIYCIVLSRRDAEKSQHLLKFAMLLALLAFLLGTWV